MSQSETQALNSGAPAPGSPIRPDRNQVIQSRVEKLSAGYTRLPNSVLMQIIHGDINKAEAKVLLLIARLTISYTDSETGKERSHVSLSKNSIAEESEKKLQREGKRTKLAEEKKKREEEEDRRYQEEYDRNVEAFQAAFPTLEARQKYLEQFAREYPMFKATGPALLSIAIARWASETKNANRTAA